MEKCVDYKVQDKMCGQLELKWIRTGECKYNCGLKFMI